jgi:serine/threonine-protein kinase RsbT
VKLSRHEVRLEIREESDVAMARRHAGELARGAGLLEGPAGKLLIAVSEIARNIVVHARHGEMHLAVVHEAGRSGVVVTARDRGPGIHHLDQALEDGFSTTKTLGLGLPSARRAVDEFEIESIVGQGTTVTMKKWAR